MVRGSIIIAALESYEVVRRQLLHFERILNGRTDIELIVMDDGSDPPIDSSPGFRKDLNMAYAVIQTGDQRPWSQPCARNRGAFVARGEWLLFTDIDHIITKEAVDELAGFDGDKMHFVRTWGILDENGELVLDTETLIDYGLKPKDVDRRGSHENTFIIRKSLFWELDGYDETFCGKYGGDDTNFNRRYGELHYAGKAARSARGPLIYVYPDPRRDKKRIFHHLRWKD